MSNCEWILVRAPEVDWGAMAIGVKRPRLFTRLCTIAASVLALACAAFLINCAIVPASLAQIPALSQPQYSRQDANGVDLLSATAYLHETDVSIGSKEHPLTHTWYSGPDGTWTWDYPQFVPLQSTAEMDSFAPAFISWPNGLGYCPYKTGPINVTVSWGHASESFTTGYGKSYCTIYSANNPTGDTLVSNANHTTFTYTLQDGTQVLFSLLANSIAPTATEVIYPDGRVLTYGYNGTALESVTRSDGLELKYAWATSFNGYVNLVSVTAINTAYEYCAPTAVSCSLKMAWPTATYSYAAGPNGGLMMTVTDSAAAKTVYTMDSIGRTTGIQLPSSTGGTNIIYAYCNSSNPQSTGAPDCPQYSSYPYDAYAGNYVLSVKRDGQLWQYSGGPAQPILVNNTPQPPTTATYGFNSPVGATEQLVQAVCFGSDYDQGCGMFAVDGNNADPFLSMTDEQGNIFYGDGEGSPLITQETKPEGNEIQFSWNGAGDLKQETLVPQGSSLSSVNLFADYDWSGCNALSCNEPDWTKDGKGNETDYTYNPSNGEIATVMLPPDNNGVRPQTNYTYAQQYAYVLNASGSYVPSGPIWVRAAESHCLTTKAATDAGTGQVDCGGGTTDKVLKMFYYGPNSGPNNLFLRGVAVTAAVNGAMQTRVTCYGYDRFGNRISETTSNAGLSLTSCDQFTAK